MIFEYYGFWELWQLYHKVIFDGVNKLILINPGVLTLDIKEDVYSAWKDWVLIDDYAKFTQAMSVSGGEPTTGAEALGSAFFLINGWKIRPWDGDYELAITGNFYSSDNNNPIVPSTQPHNILITRLVSNIVTQIETEGPSALTPTQASDLGKILANTNFTKAIILTK